MYGLLRVSLRAVCVIDVRKEAISTRCVKGLAVEIKKLSKCELLEVEYEIINRWQKQNLAHIEMKG